MTLFTVFDLLYVGIDDAAHWDVWAESTALHIHLGYVRVELVSPWMRSHGSTQTSANQQTHWECPKSV